jgi:hypothetical protein
MGVGNGETFSKPDERRGDGSGPCPRTLRPLEQGRDVFLSDQGEAVIFVKDVTGDYVIIVNLTVCAGAYEQGHITLGELKTK